MGKDKPRRDEKKKAQKTAKEKKLARLENNKKKE